MYNMLGCAQSFGIFWGGVTGSLYSQTSIIRGNWTTGVLNFGLKICG